MFDSVVKAKVQAILSGFFDYSKALSDYKVTQDKVNEFRKLMNSSDSFPKATPDIFLLMVLAGHEKSLADCQNTMSIYLKCMKDSPELFTNRNFYNRGVQRALENLFYFSLPQTPKNCNLIFHKLRNDLPKNYAFVDAIKVMFMSIETCLLTNGPRDGLVFLLDMKGVSFGHFLRPKISTLRKLHQLQGGCPFIVREIHVINTVPSIDSALAIMKPFVKSHFIDRIHFHPINMDYEKFYEECIPKSCLPSDYGGELESVEELHRKHAESLMNMSEYFEFRDQLMSFKLEEYDFNDHYESTKV